MYNPSGKIEKGEQLAGLKEQNTNYEDKTFMTESLRIPTCIVDPEILVKLAE